MQTPMSACARACSNLPGRPPWVKKIPEDAGRDEYEAMREGLCDLVRLLRYEQRAWSRRKRAVRAFMAIKLANQ